MAAIITTSDAWPGGDHIAINATGATYSTVAIVAGAYRSKANTLAVKRPASMIGNGLVLRRLRFMDWTLQG